MHLKAVRKSDKVLIDEGRRAPPLGDVHDFIKGYKTHLIATNELARDLEPSDIEVTYWK